jgi:phage/plasmid-associated DNA primase
LFLWGVENCGKSILHEALELLLTKGYKRADVALTSQGNFNAELEGQVLCIVEETDLRKNQVAYNKIKDWVTSRSLLIHRKGVTPYHSPNTTHWIQCNNDHSACPILTGDTRVVVIHVDPLPNPIPKRVFIPKLIKEAPDFLAEILKLELPASPDRLNIPVIETDEKEAIQQMNASVLEIFIKECCIYQTGLRVKFSDFYDMFQQWLDPEEIGRWSKIKVGRELPPQYPKGRNHSDAQFYIGNIWLKKHPLPNKLPTYKYILLGEYLEESNVS